MSVLWWVMLIGATALFALVLALFALAILRPGWGSSVRPARWILLGGLVLPAIVLPPLVGYGLFAGEQLLPQARAATQIEAEGRQWIWTFRYPDYGGVKTTNVLHLPAGVPVDILVTSLDVVHAFWVPRLAGQIDAVPGHVTHLRLEADQPGTYEGLCNQFCGIGHSVMRFAVIVHRPGDFAAALPQMSAPAKVGK